jgi:heptosyltransferase-2
MKMKPVYFTGVSITQLIAIIKSCDLFIGNSTGPMHIAAAVGVPVIAIFGSQHPLDSYHEWGPWSDKSIVISKDTDCPECHPTDCINFDCMNNIEAVEILEAAQNLLDKDVLKK